MFSTLHKTSSDLRRSSHQQSTTAKFSSNQGAVGRGATKGIAEQVIASAFSVRLEISTLCPFCGHVDSQEPVRVDVMASNSGNGPLWGVF